MMSLIAEIRERMASDLDSNRAFDEAFKGESEGYSPLRADRRVVERSIELADMIVRIKRGRLRPYMFEEAMTMSDFPQLFGFTVDRIILDTYQNWPQTWPQIARRRLVRDFRNIEVKRRAYGGGKRLERVPEHTEYPVVSLEEQNPITYKVNKFGEIMGFSWELGVGDVLGELDNIPQEFGQAARETENYAATELYVDAAGPHASLYTVGNANIVTGNPALSIAGLQQAFTVLATMKDEQGRPIFINAVTLVIPPALEVPARNILNATEILTNTVGGTVAGLVNTSGVEQRLVAQNWMRNRLSLVVNPYIPMVATANGSTSWFLFADTTNNAGAALEMAFLMGREEPQIALKASDMVALGGQAIDPMEGSFKDDTINYRIRHIVGAARINAKMTVASNGSGT